MPRQHTAEFKLEIVRQLQSKEKRLAQLCREHELDPTMVRGWCQRVEKHGAGAFPHSVTTASLATAPTTQSAALVAAEVRIADLERMVGRLTLENEALKRALQRASCPSAKGGR